MFDAYRAIKQRTPAQPRIFPESKGQPDRIQEFYGFNSLVGGNYLCNWVMAYAKSIPVEEPSLVVVVFFTFDYG